MTNLFTLYRRLAAYSAPYWPHILGVLLLQLLSAPLALLSPLPLKIAVDTVVGDRPLPHWLRSVVPDVVQGAPGALLALAAALMLLTTLIESVRDLWSELLQTYAGQKLAQDFRGILFRHVQRLSLSYHDMRGTADSAYRIQYDASSIQKIVVDGMIPLVGAGFTLLAMVYVTARLNWKLALVALAVGPVLFVLNRRFAPRLKTSWKEIKKLDSSAMGVVQEVLSSVRLVKAFGHEDREQKRFLDRSDKRLQRELQVAMLQGKFNISIGLVVAAGTAAALLIGIQQVRSGQLTLGSLLLVLSYLNQVYRPLKTLSKKTADLQSALVSADRAFSLLDEVPEVAERPDAKRIGRAAGTLLFLDVSFAYDAEHVVLHRVSFAVPAGTRVGIRGATGAGKSTLVGLLMRFYDPSDGMIMLDGTDLRDCNLADLRRQFATVMQDTVLFSTTIAENIAYGRDGASREEIVQAAKLANAYDFIMCLPDGFDTLVGERGMRLSGGERQRISLARAFLKDAPILILDEPTSALDVKTEAAIMDAMQRLMVGRTTFMIAHRLDTLNVCDMQIELDKGWTVFDESIIPTEHRIPGQSAI